MRQTSRFPTSKSVTRRKRPTSSSLVMRNPQMVAWIVLIGSFVAFCVICATGTFLAYWFLFDSTVGLAAELTVSRGAVTVIRPDGTSYLVKTNNSNNADLTLAPGTVLQTDANTQGYLTFNDTPSDRVVGRLFVLSNSTIRLTDAVRPRFEWSRQQYFVTFSDAVGYFRAEIPELPKRSTVMRVNAPYAFAHMDRKGLFEISSIESEFTLYSQQGSSFLFTTPERAYQVSNGMQASITRVSTEPALRAFPFEMLNLQEPGIVQPSFGVDKPDKDNRQQLPLGWGCSSIAQYNTEPLGRSERVMADDQIGLRMYRLSSGQPLGPAETACRYVFSAVGLPLQDYSSVSIRLRMKIDFQDTPTCGIVGSECPIMLQIAYIDVNDKQQMWRQGFYAERPPSDTSPPRCDTCPHDHEQIAKSAWYYFDTGDLKTQFPRDRAIKTIQYVQVYASGHQFDMTLGEVAVLGSKPPPASK